MITIAVLLFLDHPVQATGLSGVNRLRSLHGDARQDGQVHHMCSSICGGVYVRGCERGDAIEQVVVDRGRQQDSIEWR